MIDKKNIPNKRKIEDFVFHHVAGYTDDTIDSDHIQDIVVALGKFTANAVESAVRKIVRDIAIMSATSSQGKTSLSTPQILCFALPLLFVHEREQRSPCKEQQGNRGDASPRCEVA